MLAPVGLFAILLTPLVGRYINKVDPRVFATSAFAIFALVLFMRSRFNTNADLMTLMIPTIIQGVSMAVFFIPLITLALSGLSPSRIPAASGLFNFARISAGSFGASIATTFWDRRASLHHAQLAERITAYDPNSTQALANIQGSGLTEPQSLERINRVIDTQAFMMSANDVFFVSAILFIVLIGVIWLARPVKASADASAAAAAH